ncbi:MAG: hypothetical protein ACI8WB_002038 [Phenylobacterium sp.]|jgi:hypothetical protein
MAAKKVALLFSALLVLLGLIDFTNRLTVASASKVQPSDGADQGAGMAVLNNTMLDEAAVKKLLSWSDIKPVAAVVKPVVAPAVQPVVVPPVVVIAPKPVDQHKVVAAAIAGDPSQHLLGDDLLALKGVFYDGKDFASVEIQNINSKVTRYITFSKGKATDKATGGFVTDYILTEIGKYHVVLKKQAAVVKLQLFK